MFVNLVAQLQYTGLAHQVQRQASSPFKSNLLLKKMIMEDFLDMGESNCYIKSIFT